MTCVPRGAVTPDRSGATQGRPRSHADGPRRVPERRAQTRLGAISKRTQSDSGTPGTSKNLKVLYSQQISRFSRSRKGAFNRGSKSSKRSPPGGPNEPQARPGTPQERPKSPQDGSKRRPERAKKFPRPPRTAPGEHPRGPSRPDASREPFGSPFWPHLGAPGASFSSLLGVLFEPRARPARQTKALFEITGQKVFRDRCGPDVQRPLSTKLLN